MPIRLLLHKVNQSLVGLTESYASDMIDPNDVIRVQLEAKLARHPEVLARLLQQAIADAPQIVQEAKSVEPVKEEVKIEVS